MYLKRYHDVEISASGVWRIGHRPGFAVLYGAVARGESVKGVSSSKRRSAPISVTPIGADRGGPSGECTWH